jgi:hypothetical protein
MKRLIRLIKLSLIVSLVVILLSVGLNLSSATSQEVTQEQNQQQFQLVLPELLVVNGGGGSPHGGTGRGTCPSSPFQLTALAPISKTTTSSGSALTIVGGTTTVSNPTLWFYLPYGSGPKASPVEFVLQDKERKSIYPSTIPARKLKSPPEQPGIIGIQIPTPLEVGKPYRWDLRIQCDPVLVVNGWIVRVAEPKVRQPGQSASPLQKAKFYENNGIWYDALTTLGNALRKNPGDPALQQAWKDLLAKVGLQDIATQPIVQ